MKKIFLGTAATVIAGFFISANAGIPAIKQIRKQENKYGEKKGKKKETYGSTL